MTFLAFSVCRCFFKVALVAPKDLEFGFMRMYHSLASEEVPQNRQTQPLNQKQLALQFSNSERPGLVPVAGSLIENKLNMTEE